MKIENRTVTIKIGEPGDEAVLVFGQMKENAKAKINYLIGKAQGAEGMESLAMINEYRLAVLSLCESVENLEDKDGPATVDRIRRGDFYTDILDLILRAYHTALNKTAEPEAEEKNAAEGA